MILAGSAMIEEGGTLTEFAEMLQKILMVDDDLSILMIAQISLTKVGMWQVKTVDSGIKALNEVDEFEPDLILLDVMMPGMDGPTTFKKLRENASFATTPVIFMTAKVQPSEVESYCQLGAAGVISKPFDPMTLPSDIRKLLAKTALPTVA